jgi:HK97 family phage portal protein
MGNGLKPVPLTVDPEKSLLVESQWFTIQQVARYFGVPPEMIGADSGNPRTYSNLEQRNLDLLIFGVGPKIAKLESALNALMPRATYVKFTVSALLRTDTESRYESYESGIRAGWLLRNEVRQLEDREPLPGLDPPADGPGTLEVVA